MTYKTLLVAVDQSQASDIRLGLACDLAAGMDAHLIGVCAAAATAPPMDDLYSGGAMLGEALTLFRDFAEAEVGAAHARFQELTYVRRHQSEWRGRIGLPADTIIHEARGADLVIVGRRTSRAPGHGVDPADVLMAIGRPVLVVPPRPIRDPVGRPAVIAWKDSAEAQRAAAAALPLLRHASAIHVLEVCEPDATEGSERRTADIVAWLGRHGIAADRHSHEPGAEGIAQDILAFAETHTAGLIVAGGYGHARLREWALGGVTQDLLGSAPMSVLLSH